MSEERRRRRIYFRFQVYIWISSCSFWKRSTDAFRLILIIWNKTRANMKWTIQRRWTLFSSSFNFYNIFIIYINFYYIIFIYNIIVNYENIKKLNDFKILINSSFNILQKKKNSVSTDRLVEHSSAKKIKNISQLSSFNVFRWQRFTFSCNFLLSSTERERKRERERESEREWSSRRGRWIGNQSAGDVDELDYGFTRRVARVTRANWHDMRARD